MTVNKAKSINGLEYKVTPLPGRYHVVAYDQDGVVIQEAMDRTVKSALSTVVEMVYRQWSLEKMEEANWKCEICGSVRGLQINHKIHRSKGRDDRKTNMECCCPDCHRRIHEHK